MKFAPILAAVLLISAAQDKAQEDILQFRTEGRLLVGRVTAIHDTTLDITLKDGSKITVELKDIHPASIYKVREARIDPKNADAHWELAEFCKSNALYGFAAVEYDKAASIDKSRAGAAKKAKDELRTEEARSKFEQAKRLGAEKKYSEALDLLKQLTDRFTDTPYFEEAKKEAQKLADEVRKENDAKRAELEEKKRKKDEELAKAVEIAEKADLKKAGDLLAEARTSWEEGLDWEAKGNITKADKAWKAADSKVTAGRGLTERLEKSNDINTIKSAKDLQKEIDGWTVRVCYRLGRLWATELTYGEAIVWLNKGIKLDPDNHLLNDILLTLTQLKMRKNAAGNGY